MKKIGVIGLLTVLLLCGCAVRQNPSDRTAVLKPVGLWISYSEVNALFGSEKGVRAAWEETVKRCRDLHITDLYVHVRSHGDSLYPSVYFPLMPSAASCGFDVLGEMVACCHKAGIKIHAWINPYRISTAVREVSSLPQDSPAFRWRQDGNPDNDRNVIEYNGIYLNPAEDDVKELVLNGVREILETYAVDGIHFDDYFYPTDDPAFDEESYRRYCETAQNPLPLSEWRRTHVTTLIEGCHALVKAAGKNTVFSVSPAASISANTEKLYADIGEWVENGMLDAVIPQLYFGYKYPDEQYRFEPLLKEWKALAARNPSVKLLIGLAPYKLGTTVKSDREEWENGTDVVARQTEDCLRDDAVSGVLFFSASSLFAEDDAHTEQREKIRAVFT